MDEVRGILEAEVCGMLAGVVDCAVLPGDSEGDRPDEYVSVVGGDTEARGSGMHLADLEIRVVGPVDDEAAVARSRTRLRAVCAWLDADDCQLRGYESSALVVPGFRVISQSGEKGTRSRADIVHLKVGCAAL
jgi:hypothetical protein